MNTTGTASAAIALMSAGRHKMPSLEIDSPDDERRSALFRKNEALSASFDESAFPDRYAWVDTLWKMSDCFVPL